MSDRALDLSDHAGAAASGGLAAAIAFAVCQVIFLALGNGPSYALQWGTSLAGLAFGGTYAGVYFVGRARRPAGSARSSTH